MASLWPPAVAGTTRSPGESIYRPPASHTRRVPGAIHVSPHKPSSPQKGLPSPQRLPKPDLPSPAEQETYRFDLSTSGVPDTRSFANPEGYPNKTIMPHDHARAEEIQNKILFVPLNTKSPPHSRKEPWRVAATPSGRSCVNANQKSSEASLALLKPTASQKSSPLRLSSSSPSPSKRMSPGAKSPVSSSTKSPPRHQQRVARRFQKVVPESLRGGLQQRPEDVSKTCHL